MQPLTPRQIVAELDRYIVGQHEAKRAVAIAIRNRWRRSRLDSELRDEVYPKNIIMIGSTGIGKTEIARRLATLTKAPFIKVEASRFTEVGYHGRDVESMIRDLTDMAVATVRAEHTARIEEAARANVDERILDHLMAADEESNEDPREIMFRSFAGVAPDGDEDERDDLPFDTAEPDYENSDEDDDSEERERARQALRVRLEAGELDDAVLEIPIQERPLVMAEVLGPAGVESLGMEFQNLFEKSFPHAQRGQTHDGQGGAAGIV